MQLPGILAAIVLLIVYGSLYPWHFVHRELAASPLWTLLTSWSGGTDRRFLADVIINLALYMPLGMSGYLALRRHRLRGPVLLGAGLSASIEMAQIYAPARQCSAIDLLDNTIGTALGVLCGVAFERIARPVRFRVPDRGALALLFVWAASLLFPLFPVMRFAEYRLKWAALTGASAVDWLAALSAVAAWMAGGELISAALGWPRLWIALSLLTLPAEFFIVTRQPSLSEMAGAIVGAALICMLPSRPVALACGFWAVVLVRGLAPFEFANVAQGFTWIPFQGFLETTWQAGIRFLLEKFFWYGAGVWLIWRAGANWLVAAGSASAALMVIEVAQRWLPGRTAEITDPLLALFAGAGLWVWNARKRHT